MFLLTGCVGSLDIWGVNVPTDDDDDDDPGPPDIDLDRFGGVENLNVRWDPAQADEGRTDCKEPFDVEGELVEEDVTCEECDLIWKVLLEIEDPASPCLSGGTDIDVEPEMVRFIGMKFRSEGQLDIYRTSANSPDELQLVGVGALSDYDFSWSGMGVSEFENSDVGFAYYFSGEGSF